VKVLHVISSPAAGGAEVYVKDLAKQFARLQMDVHIAFVNSAANINRSSDYERGFLHELRRAHVPYFFLGDDVRRFPWRGAVRVRNYVRQHKINIYHAHLTYGILFGAFLRIPRVYTHHSIKMRVNKIAFALLGLLIDQLIGICQTCTNELRKQSGRDVITIDNGVDDERIVQVDKGNFRAWSKLQCIAVGRICGPKNYDLLVEAVSLLPARIRKKIDVKIVGEGSIDDTNRLRLKIDEERLGETIQLIGNRSDVPYLLSESHLFLMSSCYEGLPISLIEAARTGLPSVVTDVGGCREVIENCKNGTVVPPGSPEALAEAIKTFVRQPSLLLTCSENAIRLSSIYSIDRAVSRHLNVYENLNRCISAPNSR
jgi:glycosyltransferase involved in cell wall biosynthesis